MKNTSDGIARYRENGSKCLLYLKRWLAHGEAPTISSLHVLMACTVISRTSRVAGV